MFMLINFPEQQEKFRLGLAVDRLTPERLNAWRFAIHKWLSILNPPWFYAGDTHYETLVRTLETSLAPRDKESRDENNVIWISRKLPIA